MNKTLIYTIAIFMILGSVSAFTFKYVRTVKTRLGNVFLLHRVASYPLGYRMLKMSEAKNIKT